MQNCDSDNAGLKLRKKSLKREKLDSISSILNNSISSRENRPKQDNIYIDDDSRISQESISEVTQNKSTQH